MNELRFNFGGRARGWSLPALRSDNSVVSPPISLEGLVSQYLRAALRALNTQAEVLADPDYCRGQDAAHLAAAHAILADKVAQLVVIHTAETDALPAADEPRA